MSRSNLPPPPQPLGPDRYQFSLGSMLIALTVAALLMAWVSRLDPPWKFAGENLAAPRIVFAVFGTLLVGMLCYLCLRLPYLLTFFASRRRYAKELALHRQQLLAWAAETKAAAKQEREQAASNSSLS